LKKEGGEMKQSSGETSRENAKVCLRFEVRIGRGVAATHSVIASEAKQSRLFARPTQTHRVKDAVVFGVRTTITY